MEDWKVLKAKPFRGGLAVMAYAISIAINFFTSDRAYAGIGLIVLAVIWNIYLFTPEIRRLKITYPKNTLTESPAWLYIFGIVALGMLAFAFSLLYSKLAGHSTLSANEFAQQYIQGKYFKIADLADSRGIVEGRTFEDDYIYGPAVLYGTGNTSVVGNEFPGSAAELFVPVPDGTPTAGQSGVILLKDCKFRRCHFSRISFVGTAEAVEQWKIGNAQRGK